MVFEGGKRPDLIVGKSLVPAVVPVLRRLGIEERVAAVGLHKPGASFTLPGSISGMSRAAACPRPRTTFPAPRSITC